MTQRFWLYLAHFCMKRANIQTLTVEEWLEARRRRQQPPQKPGKRICADCMKPIKRHDRYQTGSDGRLRHKNCERPEDVAQERAA